MGLGPLVVENKSWPLENNWVFLVMASWVRFQEKQSCFCTNHYSKSFGSSNHVKRVDERNLLATLRPSLWMAWLPYNTKPEIGDMIWDKFLRKIVHIDIQHKFGWWRFTSIQPMVWLLLQGGTQTTCSFIHTTGWWVYSLMLFLNFMVCTCTFQALLLSLLKISIRCVNWLTRKITANMQA